MSSPAIRAAKEELETAEATVLSFYASFTGDDNTEPANMIQVFTALARSIHRAAGMLEVAAHEEEEGDKPF